MARHREVQVLGISTIRTIESAVSQTARRRKKLAHRLTRPVTVPLGHLRTELVTGATKNGDVFDGERARAADPSHV
jgi:hypothetical protein